MLNTRMEILKKFKKPDKDFLKDKECLICLESIDLELNKLVKLEDLVKLPCGCANSAYHIGCILLLLNSGQNKNFCPHCKSFYQLIYPILMRNSRAEIENALIQTRKFAHILMFHLLSNSIMNGINIFVAKSNVAGNKNEMFQVLILFYILKIFCNYCILAYSKNNLDKTETLLVYSYVFQTVLFGILIYTLAVIENDYRSGILVSNNIVCVMVDVGFRIYTEHRVIAVE